MRRETASMLADKINHVGVRKTERVLSDLVTNDLVATEYRWEDLRFPVTAINPPGTASDPGRDTDDGTFVFDATSTELIMGVGQMPHSWREGSELRPHIHWAATSAASGDVVWKLEYKLFGRDEIIPVAWESSQITVDATQTQTISSFPTIDMSNRPVSTVVQWRLSRIGGDTEDTYTADAKLFEFDIHYQVNSFGSEEEFDKYQ